MEFSCILINTNIDHQEALPTTQVNWGPYLLLNISLKSNKHQRNKAEPAHSPDNHNNAFTATLWGNMEMQKEESAKEVSFKKDKENQTTWN